MHRTYSFAGRLALSLFLLATPAAKGSGAEYNEASLPGLAPLDVSAGPVPSRAVRLAENTPAPGANDASVEEARKRLKREIDRARRHATPSESKAAASPHSAKARDKDKDKEPAPKAAAEAPQAEPEKEGAASVDADINRAVGKLIIMRFSGSEPSDNGPKAVRAMMREGLIAGVLFSGDNIQSRPQLKELAKFFLQGGDARKSFLAVSEIGGAGGAFPRIKDFESWPSERDVAAKGDPEYAYLTYRSLAASLSGFGFNLNFGPALSAERAAKDPSASFGDSPLQSGVFAKTFILGHRDGNVTAVPVVDGGEFAVRALKTLLVSQAGLPIAVAMTEQSNPLSAYEGLVRGPRFCMIARQGDEPGEAASAFARGCDAIVIGGGKESPAAVHELTVRAVAEAIKSGALSLEALNASAQRLATLQSPSAAASSFTTRTAQ